MKLSTRFLGVVALIVGCLSGAAAQIQEYVFSNELVEVPVEAIFKNPSSPVSEGYLDAPRVFPRPNRTSFNWWYFDAVNPANINESVVAIFYLATNDSFPLRPSRDSAVSIDLFLSLADGSTLPILFDSTRGSAGAARITVNGNLVSGDWSSTGFTFTEFRQFLGSTGIVVTVETKIGLQGSLTLKRTAPPHLPCTEDIRKASEPLEAVPHVGWTNSIPDADATAYFAVYSRSGSKILNFTSGIGYHDQKWGDRPFQASVKDWYWGHARVGPSGPGAYSIVWLYSVNHSGEVSANAYIARDNKTIEVGCARDCKGPKSGLDLLKIKSDNSTTQLAFNVNNGSGRLEVVVEKQRVIGEYGPFKRWTGKTTAVLNDEEILEGVALFQEFHF